MFDFVLLGKLIFAFVDVDEELSTVWFRLWMNIAAKDVFQDRWVKRSCSVSRVQKTSSDISLRFNPCVP